MSTPSTGGPRRGPVGAWVPIVSLLALVLGLGAWSLSHRSDTVAVGDRLMIPYGYVVVFTPREAEQSRALLPLGTGSGSAAVPPATGDRQVDVDVTITATDGPVRWESDTFTVSAPGLPATPPVAASAAPALIPSGTTVTRTLRFDVPAAAAGLRLNVVGADQQVPLPLPQDP